MKITPPLFEAFLKCPTKCWLRAANETPSGNTYAEWVETQNESYRVAQAERWLAETPPGESAQSPSTEHLKTAKWRFAVDIPAATAVSFPPRSSRGNEAQTSVPQPSTPSPQPPDQSLVTQPSRTPAEQASAATGQGGRDQAKFVIETRLHAVERVPSEGGSNPYRNTRHERCATH